MPSTSTSRHDTPVVTHHGARATCACDSRCQATWPAIPKTSDPTADHRAKRRVRTEITGLDDSHARSAYAAYASTPTGRVTAVSRPSVPVRSQKPPGYARR